MCDLDELMDSLVELRKIATKLPEIELGAIPDHALLFGIRQTPAALNAPLQHEEVEDVQDLEALGQRRRGADLRGEGD